MDIISAPSPNFNDRREALDMLVLHYTGMQDGPSALERMRDPEASVSAHYMVEEDGRIFQLVAEDKRAWHAGVSRWQGDEDLNSRSIGIEIVNGGHNVPLPDGFLPPFPEVQIDAVIALCTAILSRHDIPQSRIVGHSDIAPDRKEDPGEHFPWQRLSRHGIGLWPSELADKRETVDITRLQKNLAAIGYDIALTGFLDDQTAKVITAFQRRWQQDCVTGEPSVTTLAFAEAVADMASGSPSLR